MPRFWLPLCLVPTIVWSGPAPKANSAFDLSQPFPIPGSLGRVVRDGANLRFQKDPKGSKRIFVGTNLTGMACFPKDLSQANQWAKSISLRGYNIVRLHHFDWVLRDQGWGYKDRLDEFVAALKRQSVYIVIDLFSDRADNREAFKRGVLTASQGIRADWKTFATQLLTRKTSVHDCAAWKEEPAILGICPLNEDDPRFLNVPTSQYKPAFKWKLQVVRVTGYKGLVWGLNSGVDQSLLDAAKEFDVEDFHVYWDHPQGNRYLTTSGVRQPWQLPSRMLPELPSFCTEWGSLPYNELRGETGLMFVGEMVKRSTSVVISYALATNETMMEASKAPIDQFAFHTDPVRLATDRIAVLLLRRKLTGLRTAWETSSGAYRLESNQAVIQVRGDAAARRADFLGTLDGESVDQSKHMLLIRFGDAQNTGFSSHVVSDKVVKEVDNRGGLPVRELSVMGPYRFKSNRRWDAWALDPYTGEKVRRVPCAQIQAGQWQVETSSLNTELVASS